MKISQLVGALSPVNHRGLHHGYSNEKMDEKINGFFFFFLVKYDSPSPFRGTNAKL